MHLYLATGLVAVGAGDERLAPDEDEHLELRRVPLDDAVALVERGEIRDAKSILGILWLDRMRRAERPDAVPGLGAAIVPPPPPSAVPAAGTADGSSGTGSRPSSSPWRPPAGSARRPAPA